MEDKKIIELNATDRDLLVFSTPREATDSMLKELNALPNVEVTKLKLESDIIKDGVDLSTALKAEAIIQKYMKPMTMKQIQNQTNKWVYLFYKPYNSTMDEVNARLDAIQFQLSTLPADCVYYALNRSIRMYKIFPSFNDLYLIMKEHVERREILQTSFQKVIAKLQ